MAFVCVRRSRQAQFANCPVRASHKPWCGLRRPDPYVVGSWTPAVILDYQTSLRLFLSWMNYHDLTPGFAWGYDDLLTEWRLGTDPHPLAIPSRPSKAQFQKCISAIEKVLPTFKGLLPLSRAAMAGWSVMVKPNHTLALVPRWAHVVAAGILRLGYPRVAAGLMLQVRHGLRPGELLSLKGRHMILPEECPAAMGSGIFVLGVRAGTKSGRPQSVLVKGADSLELMRSLRQVVGPDDFVVGASDCAVYTGHIRAGGQVMGLQKPGWTGHSGRAGYATARFLAEGPQVVPEVCEVCRWSSVKSMRVYLDIVGVTAAQQSQELEWKHGAVAEECAARGDADIVEALTALVVPQSQKLMNRVGPAAWFRPAQPSPVKPVSHRRK
jgi:hypothetical protein